MNILMLGGTGAMGRNLAEILRGGEHTVYITSRSERQAYENINYIKCNAKNWSELHPILASRHWNVIVDFMVYGTSVFRARADKLLASCNQYFFFSSSRVYANSQTPITERSPRLLDVCRDRKYLKSDEYALAKAREEDILRSGERQNFTIIRPYITYDINRLQLGVYEKEAWLWRALQGKAIVFDKSLMDRFTTMTSGYDVALRIIALMGKKEALGETFHITTGESRTWGEILQIYLNTIEEITGNRPKVVLTDIRKQRAYGGYYQVVYDRDYDRRFDNSKINAGTGLHEYITTESGLRHDLKEFLRHPTFLECSWALQGKMDRVAQENIPLGKIPKAHRGKYRLARYFPSCMLLLYQKCRALMRKVYHIAVHK